MIFLSLDATKDNGSLINFLFAIKNIAPGETTRYFYDDNSLPWHADVSFSNELDLEMNVNALKR